MYPVAHVSMLYVSMYPCTHESGALAPRHHPEGTVPDPGKGVCADPVNEAAILGKEGPDPRGGSKGRQLSPDKGWEKTWEDDKRPRMTTPAWLRDASMHRVSWRAQLKEKQVDVSVKV